MCASSGDTGDSSDSSDSSGDTASTSTPFLSTWNGASFDLENDFLFGKPNTNKAIHFQDAEKMYLSEKNSGDKYLIQNTVKKFNNKFLFQIREIEPEVSYIDSLSILYFKKNKDNFYFVTSDHRDLVSVTKKNFSKIELKQKVTFNKTVDITSIVTKKSNTIDHNSTGRYSTFQEMQQGDIIEIMATDLKNKDNSYLLLESVYRDWTLGEIFKKEGKEETLSLKDIHSTSIFSYFFKSPLKVTALSLLIILSYFGFSTIRQRNDDIQEGALSRAFNMNKAYADIPPPIRSLIVEYYSPSKNTFENIEIVEPRYYQPSSYLIKIPNNAEINGKISIRIRATKKHRVTSVNILELEKHEIQKIKLEKLVIEKAFQRRTGVDFSNSLKEKNRDYLRTIPGDIVDIECTAPNNIEDEEIGFVLESDGFYTAASKEIQESAGNWLDSLDINSKNFLKDMYNYNKDSKIAISSTM
jgi:hypothetical protein